MTEVSRDRDKSAAPVNTSRSPFARLKPVGMERVTLADEFWAPRMETNARTTIPGQMKVLEESGRMDNLRAAGGSKDAKFRGLFFNDSDVYKWMEAASWAMAGGGNPGIAADLEEAVKVVCAAQQADGYLNSYFMGERAGERWSNLRDMHELYCAGHFIQAAVARSRCTDDARLLDAAIRLADHVDSIFGPPGKGKREGAPGHEEIEMALSELWRETGERRYLDLASYFIGARGKGLAGGDAYHQDHKPFAEMDEMTGHAVRALYLNAGAADVVAETGDGALGAALSRMWSNFDSRRRYVNGAAGSRHEGEAFGEDWELPNARAYAETCAAIAGVMWNWRMFLLDGDAKFMDLLELTLINAVLPGVSLDGRTYFYVNPLESDGGHRRTPWFDCACCPPNVARTLAALPGYFYSASKEGVWVNMYASGYVRARPNDRAEVALRVETKYPWEGEIEIVVEGEGEFSIFARIPGWCRSPRVAVNGEDARAEAVPGSYAEIRRGWRKGDTVRISLPMEVSRVECHPRASGNAGRVALMRGPVIYCLEKADNPQGDVRDFVISGTGKIADEWRGGFPGGIVALKVPGRLVPVGRGWEDSLYRARPEGRGGIKANIKAAVRLMDEGRKRVPFTAIPYFAWANREAGPMSVWVKAGDGAFPRGGLGN